MDSIDISRRETLTALGATGTLALAGCIGSEDEPEHVDPGGVTEDDFDGLRVGFLGAFTGSNGPEFGHQKLTGFLSGLAYKNGDERSPDNPALDLDGNPDIEAIAGETLEYTVNGTDFEIHVRDTGDDARPASFAATDLVNKQNVDVLYGTSNSDSLLRTIREVVRVAEVPLFSGSALLAEATSRASNCDRLLFRAEGTSAMSASVGAQYIAEQPGLEKAIIVGADYSFGRSVVRQYLQRFQDLGIEVVNEEGHIDDGGEMIFPQGYTDWRPHLEAWAERGADVVVYGFTAQTGAQFFQDFTSREDEDGNPTVDIMPFQVIGDMPSRKGLGDLGGSIEQRIQDLRDDPDFGLDLTLEQAMSIVSFGPLNTQYLWNQYDNPINNWYVDAARESYSINPDTFSGSAFTTGSAMVQAIDEQGEATSDAIIEGVYGMQVEDTPKGEGEYVFQEYNNQARSPMTIAPIGVRPEPGDDDYSVEDEYWPIKLKPGEPEFRVEKENVTIPEDSPLMGCNLR